MSLVHKRNPPTPSLSTLELYTSTGEKKKNVYIKKNTWERVKCDHLLQSLQSQDQTEKASVHTENIYLAAYNGKQLNQFKRATANNL